MWARKLDTAKLSSDGSKVEPEAGFVPHNALYISKLVHLFRGVVMVDSI